MPGNRALYDRAMEQSREAARQKNWDEALKQAARALQEFPQDADGRSSAAVALFNTGKYPQALQMLEELRASDPNNPFFLEYLASTYERMGNTSAAVAIYTQLASLQQSLCECAQLSIFFPNLITKRHRGRITSGEIRETRRLTLVLFQTLRASVGEIDEAITTRAPPVINRLVLRQTKAFVIAIICDLVIKLVLRRMQSQHPIETPTCFV